MATATADAAAVAAALTGFTAPLLLGSLFDWLLCGAFLIQIYNYISSQRAKHDNVMIKLYVAWLLFIQLLQIAFTTHTTWYSLVSGWGNVEVAIHTAFSSGVVALLTGLMTSSVQLFFTSRILILSPKHIIARGIIALIIAISLMQLGCSIAFTIKYLGTSAAFTTIADLDQLAEVWMVSIVAGDWLIAGTMVFLIRRAKERTTFRGTHVMLNKLSRHTIESGVVTATVALCLLIFFKKSPNTTVFAALEFILGSLYCNTVLANLNGRDGYRNGWSGQTTSNSELGRGNTVNLQDISGSRGGIQITRDVVMSRDENNKHLKSPSTTTLDKVTPF